MVMEELLKVVKSLVSKTFSTVWHNAYYRTSYLEVLKVAGTGEKKRFFSCTASGHYNAVCEDFDGGDAQDLPTSPP